MIYIPKAPKKPVTKLTKSQLHELSLSPCPPSGTTRANWFLWHALVAYLDEYAPDGYDAETFVQFVGGWVHYENLVPNPKKRRARASSRK